MTEIMTSADENTPLLDKNSTATEPSPPRVYKNRSRHCLQYLVAGILVIIGLLVAVTVWYTLRSRPSNSSPVYPNDTNIKESAFYPRPDAETVNISSPALYFTILALLNDAVDLGKQQVQAQQVINNSTSSIPVDSPAYRHQRTITISAPAIKLSNYAQIEVAASKYIHSKGVKNDVYYASSVDFKWSNESGCYRKEEKVVCNTTPYRSIDGSCNNLNHPLDWGVAMNPFRRSLSPEYDDGISEPRGGYGNSLPSARDVSTQIHRPVYEQDFNFTVMLAVWGQFIDHDITATASSIGANGEPISCCNNSKIIHSECFPVLLNSNDEYYSKYNISCMEFVRSAPALRCIFGSREQLNQASSYLDGSMVYGNTETLAKELRTFDNGKLKMSYTKEGRILLPVSMDPVDGCNQAEEIKKGRYCFLSGDSRANENTHLTSMHLIFAKQHNYIAEQLADVNPSWNDETLYQEARRILIAQIEHITYKEFLPNILGSEIITKLKLYPQMEGYWTKYNISVDASISNNFATSTFRFAHTLIPKMMKILANDTSSPEYVEMHKMLYTPFGLYDGELDSIFRGAFNTSVEKADNHFTDQITKHLFESSKSTNSTKNSVYGLDLVALNIQRGRDHGLPGYTKWRKYCGLTPVNSFEDLNQIFDRDSLDTISKLYKSVDDIDLYTGSLSEYPISGGLVGPTLTCLLTDQFYRLKYGDRFWYETNEQPQAFTLEQLNEIRKTTLAGIICKNADDLQTVPTEVMKSSSEQNKRIPCTQLPEFNFTIWRKKSEEIYQFNLTEIQISANDFDFVWGKNSNESIIARDFKTSLIRNAVIEDVLKLRNETHVQGTFSCEKANGELLDGAFQIKVETGNIPFDIFSSKIKFPISIINGFGSSNFTKTNRIILNTNQISNQNFSWNGNVTVIITSSSWSGTPDNAQPNENESESEEKTFESSTFDSEVPYPDSIHLREKVYQVNISVSDVEIKRDNGSNVLLPKKLRIDDLKSRVIIWNFTLPNSRSGHFTMGNESGTFKTKFSNLSNGEKLFKSGCDIYSKVLFDDPTNDLNLFNVDITSSIHECSVIAPALLHGHVISSNIFSWNGNVTIFLRPSETNLEKEEELSLHIKPKRRLELQNISGTISIGNELIWDKTHPVLHNSTNCASWISTSDTAVYPVFWSGEYENLTFTGHLELPQKSQAIPSEGMFSINLPAGYGVQMFVKPNQIYQSVVYLTENPTSIQNIDISELNKIDNWDPTSYSQIILTGSFKKDMFVWFGDIIFVLPEPKTAIINNSSNYRPRGKYFVKLVDALLFAGFENRSVIKWWSGAVPPTVLIPSRIENKYTYKQLFNDAILWSFENSNISEGDATFRTYGNQSKIILFGKFEFKFVSAFRNIKTVNLQPNVSYYSPLILQSEDMKNEIDVNLMNKFLSLNKPDVGRFAPVILLGNYIQNSTLHMFEWNLKCIILLDD